jgi:hypothetical protein
MDSSINQLEPKPNQHISLQIIRDSTLRFIKRLTRLFTLTDEEKTAAGIYFKE